MELIFWSNNTALTRMADEAGVAYVGVDFERIGKRQRQESHGDFWFSDHDHQDLINTRKVVSRGKLFVRTNPIHEDLGNEIEYYIDAGVDTLMLPMFRSVDDAERFIDLVDGRAKVILQVETAAAAECIDRLVELVGVGGIYVGLNDLHLDMGLKDRFEILFTPQMERMASATTDAGVTFGFGGIGRADDASLPIASDLIYAQYARLNGSLALVARVFLRSEHPEHEFATDLARAVARIDAWKTASPDLIDQATGMLQAALRNRGIPASHASELRTLTQGFA